MNQYENDMLDITCYAPTIEQRKLGRRALEKYYGSGEMTVNRPTRYQEFRREEWWERHRPDGTVERGGSITTGRSYETF